VSSCCWYLQVRAALLMLLKVLPQQACGGSSVFQSPQNPMRLPAHALLTVLAPVGLAPLL